MNVLCIIFPSYRKTIMREDGLKPISLSILRNIFCDIVIKVIYFTIGFTVSSLNFS